MIRNPVLRSLVVAMAVTGALAACGDDGPTSAEKVCDARAEVRSALSAVVDELEAGNFGNAKENVGAVGTAMDDLRDAVGELAADRREALAPDVEAVRDGIAGLADASGLVDLSARLGAVRADIEDLLGKIGQDLGCD